MSPPITIADESRGAPPIIPHSAVAVAQPFACQFLGKVTALTRAAQTGPFPAGIPVVGRGPPTTSPRRSAPACSRPANVPPEIRRFGRRAESPQTRFGAGSRAFLSRLSPRARAFTCPMAAWRPGGSGLNWFRPDLRGAGRREAAAKAGLNAPPISRRPGGGDFPPGAEGRARCWPYFLGRGMTPIHDPAIRGAFSGLRPFDRPAPAFCCGRCSRPMPMPVRHHCPRVLRDMGPLPPKQFSSSSDGGSKQQRCGCRFVADVLQVAAAAAFRPSRLPALGAAWTAAVGPAGLPRTGRAFQGSSACANRIEPGQAFETN